MPVTSDVYDIRQKRLRELLRDEFEGRQASLAEKIGRSDNYISRMLSSGPSRKRIGEDMARHIEGACNKPKGWLDGAKDGIREPTVLYGIHLSREAVEIGAEWQKLSRPFREQVAALVHLLVAREVKARRKAKGQRESIPEIAQ